MEKMVIRAFKKWCRENVGRGQKPCAQHAAEFFFTLGATEKDAWSKVHGILKEAGLI
jgi:hypothetical protein